MASPSASNPTILLLNLPPKTFVGINLASFNSSPNFHGITNLPVGLHFLYTGTDASLSIRHGHWLQVRPHTSTPEVFVLRWNPEHEGLDLLDAASNTVLSAVRAIPTLQGRGLVDYAALRSASTDLQASQSKTTNRQPETADTADEADDDDDDSPEEQEDPWPLLISHITPRTLSRVLITTDSTSTISSKTWTLSSISSAPQDTESIPGLTELETTHSLHEAGSSNLNFTPINLKQTWPSDSVGRDRTHKARDKSWYLGSLIDTLSTSAPSFKAENGNGATVQSQDRQIGAKELLAEIQLCFLMVLTLANYSCLEQWKRILAVVFGCKDAVSEVEGYFVEVVKILRRQLGRVEDVEGGLFEMGDEVGSEWLRGLLASFRAGVDEAEDEGGDVEMAGRDKREGGLKGELAGLEEWLRDSYGWDDRGRMLKRGMVDLEDGERVEIQMDGLDEEEESGEYAPVVVEM